MKRRDAKDDQGRGIVIPNISIFKANYDLQTMAISQITLKEMNPLQRWRIGGQECMSEWKTPRIPFSHGLSTIRSHFSSITWNNRGCRLSFSPSVYNPREKGNSI